MKIQSIALLLFSGVFLSACQQEAPQPLPAPVVDASPLPAIAEPAAAVVPTGLVCFLDEMNALPAKPESEFLAADAPLIRGWIGFQDGGGSVPANFEIVLSSETQTVNVPAIAGINREDVAVSQVKPGLINAGYEMALPLKELKPGKFEVTMSAQSNGQNFICSTSKFIIIK